MANEISKGLAGVVADTTSISQVQGEEGRLIYRGVPIEKIAEKLNYEQAAYFLLFGKMPSSAEADKIKKDLAQARHLPESVKNIIKLAPRDAHPMTILQTAMAAMAWTEPSPALGNKERNLATSIHAIGAVGTIVAWVSRHRRGLSMIEPDDSLGQSDAFLKMLFGELPNAETRRAFEVALLLHMDHDFNASTFTVRVVSSTETRIFSAISAGVGSLEGLIHGGANEQVMKMVDEIKSTDRVEPYVMDLLKNKKKIYGFGHRVYRTTDPRSVVLHEMFEKLAKNSKNTKDYDILSKVHDFTVAELGKTQKDYIKPNVDFWSGGLYKLMGIETIDYTPVFAVARVTGWCAHLLEQWSDNRIYRPAAQYVGPASAEI